MSLALTQAWLRQNIQPYPARDRLYADVDAVLPLFPSLRPKTDVYTYDDGRQQLLLCVHGLLPIVYRAAAYNIPVALWVPFDYPRAPPIVYVVAGADMILKPGRHLDRSGRTDLPYQQSWLRKHDGCSLRGLLEALQDHFSRDPPLYAKPSAHPESHPNRTDPPSVPGNRPAPTPISSLSPSLPARPVLPPKPGSQTPACQPSSVQSPPPVPQTQPQSLAERPPPPLPGSTQPTPPPAIPPHIQSHNRASSTSHPFSPPGASPTPASPSHRWSTPPHGYAPQTPPPPFHPHQPLPPLQQQSPYSPPPQVASPPPGTPARPPSYAQSPPPRPAFAAPLSQPPPPFQPPQPIRPTHGQWPPPTANSAPPPNILDADDNDNTPTFIPDPQTPGAAPPPPRPPNPELLALHSALHAKLHTSLSTLSQTLTSDNQRLQATQRDLLAGEPAIRDEMARLEAVRDVCCTVSSRLKAVVADAESRLAEVRRKGEVGVDELVCSTTIVYDQLFNLVAEDNAIEDTIYHLHRALNAGRIDLERFLRSARTLAEEQFMKRALIEKIGNNIPMGVSAS